MDNSLNTIMKTITKPMLIIVILSLINNVYSFIYRLRSAPYFYRTLFPDYDSYNRLSQPLSASQCILRSTSTIIYDDSDSSITPPNMIEERTRECLDFDVILDTLCNNTVTVLGKSICKEKVGNTSEAIRLDYAMVDQLLAQIAFLPLRTSMDIWSVLKTIEQNSGAPPDREDLYKFTLHIEQIFELRDFMILNQDKLDLFQTLTDDMLLPLEFSDMFIGSFDDEGLLSGEKYPTIKKLRNEIESLRGRIIQTLRTMLQSNDMREKLADNGFTEIEGRYCLMLKNTYKKGVGICHGSSNTGRSLYVEPIEIVEPTNEMKSLQAQLRAAEAEILYDMCKSISMFRKEIKASTRAVAEVDVYRAKAKVGEQLKGVIPEVYDEGYMSVVNARHPVLTLRGVKAVGNDIFLNDTCSSWVISGPNAGGKTIVLKTAGLFALMVRHSIPLPARRGARVDCMAVMADIGDMQSVSGDLSTFSGHLVVCREMLRTLERLNAAYDAQQVQWEKQQQQRAQFLIEQQQQQLQNDIKGISSDSGNVTNSDIPTANIIITPPRFTHSLVLLDEIGTGTDPTQGAALAQSILEELLNQRARAIVTTHYQRVKELAASDSRFRIAAMEFVDNKPTYKLRLGSVGESFALEAAKRMNLPSHVLIRAELLLDDETRRIVALQQNLEEETNRARQKQKEYDAMIAQLSYREEEIEKNRLLVQEKIIKLRDGQTEEFVSDLKKREADLSDMLVQAKLALFDTKVTENEKNKIVEEMKTVIKQVRTSTEKDLVEVRAENIAVPLQPGERVEIGRRLMILEKGNLFGIQGVVSQKDKGRGRVMLSVAGMEVKVERHLLGYPQKSGPLNMRPADLQKLISASNDVLSGGSGNKGGVSLIDTLEDAGFGNLKNMSAKDKRIIKMLQEDLVDPDKMMAMSSTSQRRNSVISSVSASSGSRRSSGTSTATQVVQQIPLPTKTQQNTLDIRGKTLIEAQQSCMQYFEDVFDILHDDTDSSRKSSGNTIVYLHVGSSSKSTSTTDEVKSKLRAWLKGLSLVGKLLHLSSASENDAYIVVELTF